SVSPDRSALGRVERGDLRVTRAYDVCGFRAGCRKSYCQMPFQVFLSHSSSDKPAVEELARRLAKEGIQAWLDKWHLIPGDPWQPALEKALADSGTCAVFVGPSGFGPWQNEEMRAAID